MDDEELKPCPMCGDPLEIVHRNGAKYVRCISGICIFETARHGYHISDDELIKRCNRRPAEDALKYDLAQKKAALLIISQWCDRGLRNGMRNMNEVFLWIRKLAKEEMSNSEVESEQVL